MEPSGNVRVRPGSPRVAAPALAKQEMISNGALPDKSDWIYMCINVYIYVCVCIIYIYIHIYVLYILYDIIWYYMILYDIIYIYTNIGALYWEMFISGELVLNATFGPIRHGGRWCADHGLSRANCWGAGVLLPVFETSRDSQGFQHVFDVIHGCGNGFPIETGMNWCVYIYISLYIPHV